MAVQQYKYVIVGGGLAGDAAVEGIREIDKDGSILLIGAEADLPYDRPPLSKQLWKGDQKIEQIFKHDQHYYSENKVEMCLGAQAVELDAHARTLQLGDGRVLGYEKLLLATGGTPRPLEVPGGDLDGICYFRTLQDYRRLRPEVSAGKCALVIGNGFIGSEMAAALCTNGAEVTMVFPGKYICSRVFPEAMGRAISELYISKKVKLIPEDKVTSIARTGDTWQVQTDKGQQMSVHIIVAGIGIVPNVSLAQVAGLSTSDGIEVDEYLRSSDVRIYAAGDVARFPEVTLGIRRLEHWDAAISQGKQAGRNMAGARERYAYMPFFFSDLFEFGYEAVGDCDSRLETFADWQEVNRTGVIYYLRDERVQGVMTCGIFGKTYDAREIIRTQQIVAPSSLVGRIKGD